MVPDNEEPAFRDSELVGLQQAERTLNVPLRRKGPGFPPRKDVDRRHPSGLRRRAEVVMVLPRPGGILFHTKAFYPAGTLRLLTGGIRPREAILSAATREVYEEVGLRLQPRRFLFHICHQRDGDATRRFHSLAFLYPLDSTPLAPTDPREQITELRPVPWEKIPDIIHVLETLAPAWRSWGTFRAYAHRVLLECRAEHPDWFVPG